MPKIKKIRHVKPKIKIIDDNKQKEKDESKLEKEVEKTNLEEFIETIKETKIKISPTLERAVPETDETLEVRRRAERGEEKKEASYTERKESYTDATAPMETGAKTYSMSPEKAVALNREEQRGFIKRDTTMQVQNEETRSGEYSVQPDRAYRERESQERQEKRRRAV